MSSAPRRAIGVVFLGLVAVLISATSHVAARPASTAKLSLEHVGSDSTAFNVLATLVIGPSEVLLWDAQYHVADARRLADRIAATGKRLKAIVLSHPDHDHYMGAAAIVERFPGTPVYMTAKALEEYKQTAVTQFRGEKSRAPQLLPDSLVTPRVLPSTRLTVDGETVEVIADVTGDVQSGTNSMLWIPSLRTVLASDVVFDGIHAWLGASDETSRTRWRESIKRIRDLKPEYVVAGHKKDMASPNTPAVLDVMDRYLADFDALRKSSANGGELFQAMSKKYPDHTVSVLLRFSSQMAFRAQNDGAAIREQLTAVNKAWGTARIAYDSAAYERMLTPDFYVLMGGRRVTREEFIRLVATRQEGAKLVRFDNPILTLTKDPAKEEWIAVVLEKLEYERTKPDGTGTEKVYSLWITRDGYRRTAAGWQITYSEAIGSENWTGGKRPPFPDW